MSEPDLDPAQNERLRAACEELLRSRYKTRKALAKMIGIAPASLTTFLGRKNGASHYTAERVAEILKRPVDELIGPRAPRSQRPAASVAETELDAAIREAKAIRAPDLPEGVSPAAIDAVLALFRGHPPDKDRLWWLDLFVKEQRHINAAAPTPKRGRPRRPETSETAPESAKPSRRTANE